MARWTRSGALALLWLAAASDVRAQEADADETQAVVTRRASVVVALEVEEGLAADGRRVAAELRAAGFEVHERELSAVPLETLARPGPAGTATSPLAVVRLLVEEDALRVGLSDTVTEKTLSRRMERGPDLGLRVVELLHATLLEIRATHFETRDAPPEVEAFVDARVEERARPLSIALGLGSWLDADRRLSAAAQLALHFEFGRFVTEAIADVALTPWLLDDPRGRSRVRAALFGGAAGAQWRRGAFRLAFLAGGGAALLWAQAEPRPGFVASAARDLDGYVEAAVLVRVLGRRASYALRLAGSVLVQGVPLTVEQESVERIAVLRGPALRATFRIGLRP